VKIGRGLNQKNSLNQSCNLDAGDEKKHQQHPKKIAVLKIFY